MPDVDGYSKFHAGLVKRFDFGLLGGVRAQFGDLSLFGRYNYGLSDVNNVTFTDQNGMDFGYINVRNTNIQLGLQYAIFKCAKT